MQDSYTAYESKGAGLAGMWLINSSHLLNETLGNLPLPHHRPGGFNWTKSSFVGNGWESCRPTHFFRDDGSNRLSSKPQPARSTEEAWRLSWPTRLESLFSRLFSSYYSCQSPLMTASTLCSQIVRGLKARHMLRPVY